MYYKNPTNTCKNFEKKWNGAFLVLFAWKKNFWMLSTYYSSHWAVVTYNTEKSASAFFQIMKLGENIYYFTEKNYKELVQRLKKHKQSWKKNYAEPYFLCSIKN